MKKTSESTGPLDEDEQREILVQIARESGSDTARIAAIKALRSMDPDGDEDDDEFDKLEDEVAARRNRRQAS